MGNIVSCPKCNAYLEGMYAGVPPCEDINGLPDCECFDLCTQEFDCNACVEKCGDRNAKVGCV